MINRRSFLKKLSVMGVASTLPATLFSSKEVKMDIIKKKVPHDKMIWANLLHLSYNMWQDVIPEKYSDENYVCTSCNDARLWGHPYRPYLTFDQNVWDTLIKEMSKVGMNMAVIDLGDAIQYESHPEIAVKGAWSPYKLRKELEKLRKLGIEPIPKLNFATSHDAWLGEYARMVSTRKYYQVCEDLINEVIDLFDMPRFFHLGMDEESFAHQRRSEYAIVRQHDLWWRDLFFFIDKVERKGVRSWIWSDYGWRYPELFFKKMPKSVLQSNWYYGSTMDLSKVEEKRKPGVTFYQALEDKGYDQIPTGSNHTSDINMKVTVDYCKKIISPHRLYGFMTAPWRPTLEICLDTHKNAIWQVGKLIK